MVYDNLFNKIISLENLFSAWDEFKKGKRSRLDVSEFELNLEQNIFQLHKELKKRGYKHGSYKKFIIHDPKLREIHKAEVRDRILHHATFNILNPLFEPTFIPASFSCRIGKGTHKGVKVVTKMLRSVSRNNTRKCYALKCDVRKFFDSIDHSVLMSVIRRRIRDKDTLDLMSEMIGSFSKNGIEERERVWRCVPKEEYRSAILHPNCSPIFT